MRRLLPVFMIILCVVIGLAVPAGAAKVQIKGRNFVADTFCGVPAYYDQIATISTSKWQCTEYVRRFYRDAYGLSINSIFAPIMLTEGYALKITKTPKPGDIFHSPALRRGKTTDHTAIVKSVGDGYVTLIEQNHRYNGYASVDRVVAIPDRAVDFYTPVGVGQADPRLKMDQIPVRTKRAQNVVENVLDIGNGVRKILEPGRNDPQDAAARAVPSTQATEPETTTQTAAAAAVADPIFEEFVMREMARAEAAKQQTAALAQDVTAAELASPSEAEPARKVSAPVLAVLFIALLAALGSGSVFLYKNEWFRRRMRRLLRK